MLQASWAEEVSNSRNKIHQTTYKPLFRALYMQTMGSSRCELHNAKCSCHRAVWIDKIYGPASNNTGVKRHSSVARWPFIRSGSRHWPRQKYIGRRNTQQANNAVHIRSHAQHTMLIFGQALVVCVLGLVRCDMIVGNSNLMRVIHLGSKSALKPVCWSPFRVATC